MEPFAIKQATFLTSVGLGTPYPPAVDTGVEIAMVGKSNVGKSSLINSLCNNFKLARVSSSPGKTRLINYFLINREFYLVDLPGYGFAKAPKTEQQKWGQLMESYLSGREELLKVIQLVDIRHEPTAQDVQMYEYLRHYGLDGIVVATKADKISGSQRSKCISVIRKKLGLTAEDTVIPVSSLKKTGNDVLLERIEETGSLLSASRSMGMSYTKARGMLEMLEESLGRPVLDRRKGGADRQGATLTPFGRKYISLYREFQREAKADARKRFDAFCASVEELMEEEI